MMKDKKKISPFEALKQSGFELKKPNSAIEEPKKIIVWEKWRCPFGTNLADEEWPGALSPPHRVDSELEFDEDNIIEEELPFHLGKNTQLISTGLGIIPLTEYTNPAKIFNFWTGHTNFPITHKVKDIIDNVDGVELLTIFTRYRLRVGIGKLFTDGQVMREINKRVSEYLNNKEQSTCPLSEEPFHKKVD